MSEIFLGQPDSKTTEFIKDKYCDIFIKRDGTKVRPDYDSSKTTINIYEVEDYQNVRQFSFGKSYTEIQGYYSHNKEHGIDLSRTKIGYINQLEIYNSSLTSFTLPNSLIGFVDINLNSNSLTGFSLPASFTDTAFNNLNLNGNRLSSFTMPNSVINFGGLLLDGNQLKSFRLDGVVQFNNLDLAGNQLTSFSCNTTLFGSINLTRNQLTNVQLHADYFGTLYLDNSCTLDMSYIVAATRIPDLDGLYSDIMQSRYTGIIRIKAGLLADFQNKWGAEYNYQEV